MFKKILLSLLVIIVLLVAAFVIIVGPWPAPDEARPVASLPHYAAAEEAIADSMAAVDVSDTPGRLEAGWAKAVITPPVGAPLGGYGARQGAPSEGVHDDLYAKALALSDGTDTIVLLGSDTLTVIEEISRPVRERISEQTDLDSNDIVFNSQHTHSGMGGALDSTLGELFGGPYDPRVLPVAIDGFEKAILDALDNLEPAKMAHGAADAEEYIRNRSREAKVDPELSWMIVEQDDGDRCNLVRFSAHPTVLGADNLFYSAEFPGELMAYLSEETGGETIYLGGAVGSMSARAPKAENDWERIRLLGEGLGQKFLASAGEASLAWEDHVDVAAIGIPLQFPDLHLRLTRGLRLSPIILPYLGLDSDAWLHAAKIGDVMIAAFPADYSGEMSVDMRRWADSVYGVHLWCNSFSGDYIGYLSPDKYYNEWNEKPEIGFNEYETQVMSWTGPEQEAFFNGLMKTMVARLQGEEESSTAK